MINFFQALITVVVLISIPGSLFFVLYLMGKGEPK